MRRFHCGTLAALAVTLAFPSATIAGDPQDEINYLLDAVGRSGCAFVRNGDEHSATDAASHLRMKYRKGKQYVNTADQFIERLASKSSWTGRAYYIVCPGQPAEPSGKWLSKRLAQHRTRREQ